MPGTTAISPFDRAMCALFFATGLYLFCYPYLFPEKFKTLRWGNPPHQKITRLGLLASSISLLLFPTCAIAQYLQCHWLFDLGRGLLIVCFPAFFLDRLISPFVDFPPRQRPRSRQKPEKRRKHRRIKTRDLLIGRTSRNP